MRKHLIAACFSLLFVATGAVAQQMAAADSMLRLYKQSKDPRQQVELAGRLSLMYLTTHRARSDSFGRKAIEIAELSRNRSLMIRAYMSNGERFSYLAAMKEYTPKSIEYYQKAYQLARETKLENEQVSAHLGLAAVHRSIPEADKAMNYTSQAFALISDRSMDSLQARCYLSFGNNYLLKKEKLLALKNFFNGLRIAEVLKDASLLRDTYLRLAEFYHSVDNFDKAIDYAVKAREMLSSMKNGNEMYLRVSDYYFIGRLFVEKKDYDLARKSFDDGLALADSLRYDPVKISGYFNIFNMYLLANRPAEALAFFEGTPAMKEYIIRMGMNQVIDHAYAYIYTDMNRLDSAGYYYQKALPFFSSQANNANKINFFNHYARYQFRARNYNKAIELLKEAGVTAKQMNDLEWEQRIYKQLDSAYQLKGDFRTAVQYSALYQKMKDTLELLGRQDEILQLQLADEDERQARQAREAEEARKRRHHYQYLAITIGIASLFIFLVMLGTFRVSATTIRIVGFFTFLMLFEFLFLVFKKNIHSITEGEPWKDLAFMIGLAAVLLPLHHWAERKVIHYLTTRQLIRLHNGKHFIRRIFKKKTTVVEEV